MLGFIGIDEAAADLEAVIAADELVVDELTAAVGVFHEGSGVAVGAGSDDAGGIGELRAGFTHGLSEAIEALLGGEEGADDAGAAVVGDERIGCAVEADDAAAFGRRGGLVVGIAAGGVEPEGAVVIHLGEHLGDLAACVLEGGTIELDEQAIRHAGAVGDAEDGDFARIDIVVSFQQCDEIADEGHIGCLGGFAIDIPTREIAAGCHADGRADMRVQRPDHLRSRPAIAMEQDDDGVWACACGNLNDGGAGEAARLLRPSLREAERGVGEVSIWREHRLDAVKLPRQARGVDELIRVGDGAAGAGEGGHGRPRKQIGGALDLVALARDAVEGEERVVAAIDAFLGDFRHGIVTAAGASAARDGEEHLIEDETRIQGGGGGGAGGGDLHAGEIRHGDRKGGGIE